MQDFSLDAKAVISGNWKYLNFKIVTFIKICAKQNLNIVVIEYQQLAI